MDETTNMKLKKPVENEYISIEIINENMDIIDTGMKEISDSVDAPVFDDSGSVVGITNKTTLLASFVSKMPLVKFLRNVKAGFKLVSFVGDIVNNCVTDNANLPLSAAQGKALMDLYTVLNTKIADTSGIANTANAKVDSVEEPVFDDSGSVVGITNKTTLLASFVSKMPLVKFLRNVKAGFKLVSFVGDIVNNCVTDNANLPLSAAQGKALMDLYTVLNTKIADTSGIANTANAKIELDGPIKTIAYGSDKNKWAFQQQFPDGVILSLGISETEIFYDYYDGKTWTRKWTR